jgi:hypothetical protein
LGVEIFLVASIVCGKKDDFLSRGLDGSRFDGPRTKPRPCLVESVLPLYDVMLCEPSTKHASLSRVWHAFRTKAIQVSFVVPPQFDVFHAVAIAERVAREIQNMARLHSHLCTLQNWLLADVIFLGSGLLMSIC